MDTFKRLSDTIGADKIIWRFDPIVFADNMSEIEHVERFNTIAETLQGYTNRVTFSFMDEYKKIKQNMNATGAKVIWYPGSDSDSKRLRERLEYVASFLSRSAVENDMEIETCAEKIDLSRFGIKHGKCIDPDMINKVFNLNIANKKDRGQRKECGCAPSIDIGEYNTCGHGCSYCYATENHIEAKQIIKRHDPVKDAGLFISVQNSTRNKNPKRKYNF